MYRARKNDLRFLFGYLFWGECTYLLTHMRLENKNPRKGYIHTIIGQTDVLKEYVEWWERIIYFAVSLFL